MTDLDPVVIAEWLEAHPGQSIWREAEPVPNRRGKPGPKGYRGSRAQRRLGPVLLGGGGR